MTQEYSTNKIMDYIKKVIEGPAGLHAYEYHEVTTPKPGISRDDAVCAWLVRCLGNDTSDRAQDVVDQIVTRRLDLKNGNN